MSPDRLTVTKCTIRSCIESIQGDGISIEARAVLVERNEVRAILGWGIRLDLGVEADGADFQVLGNDCSDNTEVGLLMEGDSTKPRV